jgi:hypothetical protein
MPLENQVKQDREASSSSCFLESQDVTLQALAQLEGQRLIVACERIIDN